MAFSIQYWSNYTKDFVKIARKSKSAVASDRVLRFVFHSDIQCTVANVQASMKDKSYKVEVQLDEGNILKTSSCECPMKEFKCHHVAAVLLYGYKSASKTDIKCSWIKHPKSVPPKEIKTMDDLYPSRQPEYRALPRPFSVRDRDTLYRELGGLGRFTALHWVLAPEPDASSQFPIPFVEDLLLSADYGQVSDPEAWLRGQMAMNTRIIADVASRTIGQRDHALWAAARKLRFTASNFGQILGAVSRNRLTTSLKKRLCSAYNLDRVAAIQWGVHHEAAAVRRYCEDGAKVEMTGIWFHESGVLAASPDGLVVQQPGPVKRGETTAAHKQLLEVKCPYSAKDMTVMQAATSMKEFFLGVESKRLHLKPSHDYWHQIQGQLHITGAEVCDLAVWTTKDFQVIRINKAAEWQGNLARLIDFYFSHFIPSMINP